MQFNIFSLHKARENDFYYGFEKVPGIIVLKRDVDNGKVHQLALMTETKGRWTLDGKILLPPKQSLACRQPKVLANSMSMDLLHNRSERSGSSQEESARGNGRKSQSGGCRGVDMCCMLNCEADKAIRLFWPS